MRKIFFLGIFVLLATGLFAQTGTAQDAFNSGSKHYDDGEYDLAIADFTRAIRLNSRNALYYNWRGLAYFGRAYPHKWDNDAYWRDDWNRAVADFEAALRLEPNNTDARERLEYARKAAGTPLYPPYLTEDFGPPGADPDAPPPPDVLDIPPPDVLPWR
jgi:tetratricopeptide (TPR) repeat protein